MNKRERVARAIEKALYPLTEPDKTTTLRGLADGCADAAIAAYEAEEEPSEAEVEAAREIFQTFGQQGHLRASAPSDELLCAALRAARKARMGC